MEYRNLSNDEIISLEKQGCFCKDWSFVLVSESFTTDNIHQVRFEGEVKLGLLKDQPSGSSGLYYSFLKDCEIGDMVYISQVGRLEGYVIEKEVTIENVSSLMVEGETSFGNGFEVEVLNEGGGRELLLFDRLSSQIAYLMVFYRHEQEMIAQLENLIQDYSQSKRSSRGKIESGCLIRDVQTIRNVNFGPEARIIGAQLLEEGTIVSCKEDPARIGDGVIAKKFIIHSGSRVDSGAILETCFVGQGVRIGKQFSAESSVFFANCEGFHGEAVSLFAGPYTVTHHKSSLLIAGMFSFFNAGSGTNQSNHMYKLGPLHQGILERGSKTGSFAYLLWPSRIGAFTVVMDKHSSNFDTSEFPFSYLTTENGKSILTPAMNLFTVGTRRDSDKWPNRDRRKDPDKLDLIRFELFSPYIVAKMIQGSEILQTLYDHTSKKQKYVKYKGISILRLLLKTCRKFYQIALKKYFGELLLNQLEKGNFENMSELRSCLKPAKNGRGDWIDLAGLLAPQTALQSILQDLKDQVINDIEHLHLRLKTIHDDYDAFAWSWYAEVLEREEGIQLSQITKEQLQELVMQWKVNSLKLNNMILTDAEKEFDQNSTIGFGPDGDEEVKKADFSLVRGTYEENKFVKSLRAENKEIEKKANGWMELLEKERVYNPLGISNP
ncbi:MAG: DUF4954 family protein [Saprospiraceae bacterium]|nr:DUF4954 family protein [Saprospiraceae bacterium]